MGFFIGSAIEEVHLLKNGTSYNKVNWHKYFANNTCGFMAATAF
jgi:hypothetical protein